jgi:hypothetical protein
VQLSGGVKVTLHITYYHRFLCPGKAKNKKSKRGMYPMLILPSVANGFVARVRQCMMKCAALLGSHEEAVQMLAEEGLREYISQGNRWYGRDAGWSDKAGICQSRRRCGWTTHRGDD